MAFPAVAWGAHLQGEHQPFRPDEIAILRVAASLRDLSRWGYHCALKSECDEHCAGGRLYDVDWPSCAVGVARKSARLRVLRGLQAERRVCGTLRGDDLPAWVVRDLDDLSAWERHYGLDSSADGT